MGLDRTSPTLHCQSITCNNYTHLVSGNINHQSIVAVASNGEGEKKRRKNHKTYWSISLYNIFETRNKKSKGQVTNDKLYPSWLVFINLTIDEMHISPCPGKVHVTKDRKCAGIGASIAIPGIVDNQDACDQVSWHLNTHAEDNLTQYQLND